MLWIAGIFSIALLFYLLGHLAQPLSLLFGALLILVGLSGHLALRESNATFWLFNHRLWLGALLALVGAGLFAAGLVAIIETIKLLFGLSPPGHAQEHIISISLCFVGPVSFLAFAPRSFDDPITAREESDFTIRAAAALVKFVLVPLLLVYTAILYAYAVKIAFAWELPKGTLGGMVVGYLLVGAATLMVGYPSRETSGPLVRFFWRCWVALTALPVVLLFIAVGRRLARLRSHRAALFDGADRRLGTRPRDPPSRARGQFRSSPRAGRAGPSHVCCIGRSWRHHRPLRHESEATARFTADRYGNTGRRQDCARGDGLPDNRSAQRVARSIECIQHPPLA